MLVAKLHHMLISIPAHLVAQKLRFLGHVLQQMSLELCFTVYAVVTDLLFIVYLRAGILLIASGKCSEVIKCATG